MERTGVARLRTAGPRTAVIWTVLRAELSAYAERSAAAGEPGSSGESSLKIVDVGGGTGGFAVPLAQAGHLVTVVDPSPDALAALVRRAADAGVASRVRAMQGDADSLGELIEAGTADLVLCHSVLEIVDDPASVAAALAAVLRPGGAASVLVANRAAAVLSRAVAGQWQAVAQLLDESAAGSTSRDALRRRFDAGSATDLLAAVGLTVEQVHGVRVVADLVPGVIADADPEALLRFEIEVAAQAPYRDVATQLHLLARRR